MKQSALRGVVFSHRVRVFGERRECALTEPISRFLSTSSPSLFPWVPTLEHAQVFDFSTRLVRSSESQMDPLCVCVSVCCSQVHIKKKTHTG